MPARLNPKILTLEENPTSPSTPANDDVLFFAGSDGRVHSRSSSSLSDRSAGNITIKDEDLNVLISNALTVKTSPMLSPLYKLLNSSKHQEIWLPIIPGVSARKWWYINGVSGGFAPVGIAAPSTTGTLGSDTGIGATYTYCTTAASSGSNAGITSTFNVVRRGYNPLFAAKLSASDINVRVWVGLFSAAPGNVDNLGTIKGIGFRYSPAAGDTGFVGVVSDGTSQAVTPPLSAGGVSTFNPNDFLEFRVSGDTVYFYKWGSEIHSLNTNLPTLTQDLGLCVRVITTEAVAKSIVIANVWCDFD